MPIANPDLQYTRPGTPVVIPVLANDQGQNLSLVAISSPISGSVVPQADGTVLYTPGNGFRGIDNFTYTVRDSNGLTTDGVATVVVNTPPLASDIFLTIAPGDEVTIPVLAHAADADGDPLSLAQLTQPLHGAASPTAAGTIHYAPPAEFIGEDSFGYTVTDRFGASSTAVVRVNVAAPLPQPVVVPVHVTTETNVPVTIDVLTAISDPPDQSLQLVAVTLPTRGQVAVEQDQRLTYTPLAGFSGEDTFSYTVSDSRGWQIRGTVTVAVELPESDPPPVDVYEAYDFEQSSLPSGLSTTAGPGSAVASGVTTSGLAPAAPPSWGTRFLRCTAATGERAYVGRRLPQPRNDLAMEFEFRPITLPTLPSAGKQSCVFGYMLFGPGTSGPAVRVRLETSPSGALFGATLVVSGAVVAETSIAAPAVATGRTYRIRIVARGDQAHIWIDGQLLFSGIHPGFGDGLNEWWIGANAPGGHTPACSYGFDNVRFLALDHLEELPPLEEGEAPAPDSGRNGSRIDTALAPPNVAFPMVYGPAAGGRILYATPSDPGTGDATTTGAARSLQYILDQLARDNDDIVLLPGAYGTVQSVSRIGPRTGRGRVRIRGQNAPHEAIANNARVNPRTTGLASWANNPANRNTSTGGRTITLRGFDGLTVEGLYFHDNLGSTLDLQDCLNSRITKCEFGSVRVVAVSVFGGAGVQVDNCYFWDDLGPEVGTTQSRQRTDYAVRIGARNRRTGLVVVRDNLIEGRRAIDGWIDPATGSSWVGFNQPISAKAECDEVWVYRNHLVAMTFHGIVFGQESDDKLDDGTLRDRTVRRMYAVENSFREMGSRGGGGYATMVWNCAESHVVGNDFGSPATGSVRMLHTRNLLATVGTRAVVPSSGTTADHWTTRFAQNRWGGGWTSALALESRFVTTDIVTVENNQGPAVSASFVVPTSGLPNPRQSTNAPTLVKGASSQVN